MTPDKTREAVLDLFKYALARHEQTLLRPVVTALSDLWLMEGGECHHGIGLDACPGDENGPCVYDPIRATIRATINGGVNP